MKNNAQSGMRSMDKSLRELRGGGFITGEAVEVSK